MNKFINIFYIYLYINHSPVSKNFSAIFIEKEKIKAVYPDRGVE